MVAIRPDPWLGGILGRPAFRVHAGGDLAQVAPHAAGQGQAFYDAKVSADDVGAVRALSALGFYVVDVNVRFSANPGALAMDAPNGVPVGELADGDADDVLDVASTAFRFSRFHLDPAVPKAVANAVKREWVRNYVRGQRGDRLFVARAQGRARGFLAALRTEQAAVIDLVGVAPDAQGCGLGRALVAAFARHYAGARLDVGTQVANVPSTAFYETLGFRLAESQYVLHRHVGAEMSGG